MGTVAAEETKSRIRAVAVELFTTQGYEQTSLREIADRVGMTKASLYYHYPSKQALLQALITPLLDEYRRTAQSCQALPHTPENVRWALGQILDVMIRNGSACALMMRDVPAVLSAVAPVWEELITLSRQFNGWLAGPNPTDEDRIRALAATETLGAAISANMMMENLSEETLRRTLLHCAVATLEAGTPHDQGVPQVVLTTTGTS
ncbi:TetR/AcrR family transcriptional regulator [Actinomycetes bacterium KLBMP 9797]